MTSESTFHASNGKIEKCKMMNAENTMYDYAILSLNDNQNVSSENKYEIVKLYYSDKQMSLILVLPNQNNQKNNISFLQSINYNLKSIEFVNQRIHLHLPKFEIETCDTAKSLKQSLQKLGMTDMFLFNNADFSRMTSQVFCNSFFLCILCACAIKLFIFVPKKSSQTKKTKECLY